MTASTRPILYSFRRCPYAMRARLAVSVSDVAVELREILLRDKASAFLETSPSATVPCLKIDGLVIDESLDVMTWALAQNDPEGWLEMPALGHDLIAEADGPFKEALDRTKYASRHPDVDPDAERKKASVFLFELNGRLANSPYLLGDHIRLADMAILPFVRQFAFVDIDWFRSQDWPHLEAWLDCFLSSDRFARIMRKLPPWRPQDAPLAFRQAYP